MRKLCLCSSHPKSCFSPKVGALVLFLGIAAFIKNRRAKRLVAIVDSNQIQGPPPMQSFNPTMAPQGSYNITAPPGTYAPPAGYPAPAGSAYPFNGYASSVSLFLLRETKMGISYLHGRSNSANATSYVHVFWCRPKGDCLSDHMVL